MQHRTERDITHEAVMEIRLREERLEWLRQMLNKGDREVHIILIDSGYTEDSPEIASWDDWRFEDA